MQCAYFLWAPAGATISAPWSIAVMGDFGTSPSHPNRSHRAFPCPSRGPQVTPPVPVNAFGGNRNEPWNAMVRGDTDRGVSSKGVQPREVTW